MITLWAAMAVQGGREVGLYVRVGPGRSLLGWIILGLIAGWLAGKIARGRGFGCIGDILLGLIGSVVGGWIFTKLGIVHENAFLYSLAAATVGAVVLVSLAHLFFGGKNG
jgi:uncharacterized membrane protein YeaQ/YmgE (transglycosylase-associated protein family)